MLVMFLVWEKASAKYINANVNRQPKAKLGSSTKCFVVLTLNGYVKYNCILQVQCWEAYFENVIGYKLYYSPALQVYYVNGSQCIIRVHVLYCTSCTFEGQKYSTLL